MQETKDIIMDYLELPTPIALILDAAGNIEHLSVEACELLGYELSELLGGNWISICLPQSWQLKTKRIYDAVSAGYKKRPQRHTYPVLAKDRRQHGLAWHIEQRLSPSGAIIGSISTGIKVRDNALQEKNVLLQSAARNQAVLDNAIEAIISINDQGTITHVNKTTEKIFGYAEQELVGQNITYLIPETEKSLEQYRNSIHHYLATDSNKLIGINRELSAKHKDGRQVPIELTVAEISIAGMRSFTGIMRDISERKISEARLKQSKEEVQQTRDRLAHMDRLHIASEMSTGIAHELNQPLTAISMYAQACRNLASNGNTDVDSLLSTLIRIDKQAQRAGDIIRNIRALVGKQDPHHQLTNINDLIHSTIELAQVDIECRTIRFNCECSETLPLIEIVSGQIQQVILNLIRNACDAMTGLKPQDKTIRIITEQTSPDFITIILSDTGIGLDRDQDNEQLFQAFYSTKTHGMGMGLAISHSIINNHGGELRVNKEYRDGAEFYFTLPVMPIFGDR